MKLSFPIIRLALLLGIFSFSIPSKSQTILTHQKVYSDSRSLSYKSIDLNSDGLMDIVSFASMNTKAEIYLNQGDFIFKYVDASVGEENEEIKGEIGFVDFDNDGDMDIVSAQCSACANNEITLYENNNFKTFDKKYILEDKFGGFPDLVYQSGDFNNDGFQDLIVSGDGTKIFYNTGQNSFESPMSINSSINGNNLDAIDLNQDGMLDFILFGSSASYTFVNSSDGFDSGTLLEGVVMSGGYMDKYDINKDGIKDYYVDYGNCLKASLSNDDGTFFSPTYDVICGNFLDTRYALIHADEDNNIDVLSGANAGDGIYLRKNNGSGFDAKVLVCNQGFQINYFLTDDFNNDGLQDVVYYDKWRDLSMLEGELNPDTYFSHMIATDTKVRIADIDDDNQSDLIVFDETWLGINLFDRSRNEFKGLKTLFNFHNWVIDGKMADMDGDGDSDLIVVLDPDVLSPDQTSVFWVEQNDGAFENIHVVQSGRRNYSSLNVEDFDKDGDMDMVLHRILDGGEYLNNNGDNTFVSTPIYARGRYTKKIDFNQDGFTDIIAWENGGSTFHYIENDKTGGFKANERFGDEQTIYDVENYDLDQDGDLDVILSVIEDETTKIKLLDNDNFTFENTTVISEEYVGTDLLTLPITQDQLGIVGSYTLDTYLQTENNTWQLINGPTDKSYKTIDRFINVEEGKIYILAVGSDDPGIHLYSTIVEAQDADNDGFTSEVDCDDSNPDINPDAEEIVNNDVDEDCDGIAQMIDVDEDGFNSDEDCNDENADINPNAIEIPGNGIDENCDGLDVIVLTDDDNDGFLSDVDCDDDNPNINPDQLENISNNIDDNCDGVVGEQIYAFTTTHAHNEEINDFIAFDVNDDGLKDVVFATEKNVYYISSIDNFSSKTEMINNVQLGDFSNVRIADMDNDGDFDLVCLSLKDMWYQVFINYDGVIVAQATFDVVDDIVSFDLADINGDELPDMVYVRAGNSSKEKLGYKLNNGFRYFSDEVDISNDLINPISIHLSDLNDDEDIDIVIHQDGESDQIHYYLGMNGTNYSSKIPICTTCDEVGAMTMGIWQDSPSILFSNNGGNVLSEGIFGWSYGSVTDNFSMISEANGVNNIVLSEANDNCESDLLYSSTMSKNVNALLDNNETVALRSSIDYTMDLLHEDLTGDHKAEIVFYDESNGGISILTSLLESSDHDMDGYNSEDDCDDCDALIHPGAAENLSNGIDDNCDGVFDDLDQDMDGYGLMIDCDDTNPDVNPGAEEIPDNGIDDDCFGGDAQSQYNITTYAEAKIVDEDGDLVNEGQWAKLTGIVHGINYLESSSGVLMLLSESNDEGIWLFSFDGNMTIPNEGDEITVYGELVSFRGLTELSIHSIDYLSTQNPLFDPKPTQVIGEEEEGDFVRLRNYQFVNENDWKGDGTSFNVSIFNGSEIFLLRVDDDTELASSPIPNSPFDVIGLVGQFDLSFPYTSGYQVYPRYLFDFQETTGVEDFELSVGLYPSITDSQLTLETDQEKVSGKIYSLDGRMVKYFEGKSISVEDLAPGLYILKSNVGSAKFVKM